MGLEMAEHLENIDFPHTERRTQLSAAVLARLENDRIAVVTTYSLFHVLRAVLAGDRKGLYLRGDTSPTGHIDNVRTNLLSSRAIETDPDYGRSVYRVLPVGESAAEEVCALANPFGHISHLSAMQRWGLTERRPEALYLTMPPASAARPLVEARMAEDYGTSDYSTLPNNAWLESLPPNARLLVSPGPPGPPVKLHFVRHPKRVRGREISVYETRHPARWLQVQDFIFALRP